MNVAARRRLRRRLLVGLALAVPLLGTPSAAMAGSPSSQTVVGTVVRAYVEHANQQDAGADTDFGAPLTWVRSATGTHVRVPTAALAHVPLGATVSVTVGAKVTDSAAANDHVTPAQQVLSASVLAPAVPAPAPATTTPRTTAGGTAAAAPVTNSVSIALVAPAGGTPDATTLSQVTAAVAGPVAQFWGAQSQGVVSLGVADTHDWMATVADCSDPFALWDEVAGRIGFTQTAGRHLLLYLPNAPQCSYGLGTVGAGVSSGGLLYVRDVSAPVIAHELGHNFGLGHSGRLECQGALETGTCTTAEYGDLYDVMGASWSQVGSLSAGQAASIGLLPPAQVQAVNAFGGSYSLAPLSAASGTRALRLVTSSGTAYYLEYRTASGQDGYLGTSANVYGLRPGVLLHRAQTADPVDSSLLLDATPTATAGYATDRDDVIPVGVPVALPGGTLTLTVTGMDLNGATLAVQPPAPAGGSGPSADIGGSGAAYYLSNSFGGPAEQVFDYGAPSDATFVGDWTGSGVDTLMLRRGNTFYVRNSNSTGVADSTFSYGDPTDTVLVGDWDGDGRTTLTVRRGNTYYVRNTLSSGVADVVFSYGDPTDTVLVGDWDGNGTSSLAVRRGNQYFVRNTLTSGIADATFSYGEATDRVLIGRWSAGQPGSSLAVRRGNVYFLRYSLTSGNADSVVTYGDSADTAFPGDWNGDGVDTLGVRRAR